MFLKAFVLTVICSLSVSLMAEKEDYFTCGKIKREDKADKLSQSCLEKATPEARYKSEFMMHKLLLQVQKIEAEIGPQSVFFVARAGESLAGFTQLRSHNEQGAPIYLDEVFNYGKSLIPQNMPYRLRFEPNDYDLFIRESDGVFNLNHAAQMNEIRKKIVKKYADPLRPNLVYSHAGILFKTELGWNILHELMPCNQTQKAYVYSESAIPYLSRFFLDEPSAYKALIIPLKKDLQKRLLHIVNAKHKRFLMSRSPVYRAMANPWKVNDHNSNSFILEVIEAALLPIEQFDQLYASFKAKENAYQGYLDSFKINGKDLTTQQKDDIEKLPGYKQVCRYDLDQRKVLVQNYIDRGFQPSKVVLNWQSTKGQFWTKIKMNFVSAHPVPEHIQPNLKDYKNHLMIGVGEAVTVDSIWNYILNQNLQHPQANPDLFEVSELTFQDMKNYENELRKNIDFYKGKYTKDSSYVGGIRFTGLSQKQKEIEHEHLTEVIHNMDPVEIRRKKLEIN